MKNHYFRELLSNQLTMKKITLLGLSAALMFAGVSSQAQAVRDRKCNSGCGESQSSTQNVHLRWW